jgi:hypothetical protein
MEKFLKGETQHYVFLTGGIVVMSLGAAVVAKANSIIPSDTSKSTVDGVSVATIKTIRNIGVVFILVGLALMGWYGWILFGLYGGKERAKELYAQAEQKVGEWKKKRGESVSSVSSTSSA